MKAIIGGALVALGLAGAAAAQEQAASFTRVSGRFVSLGGSEAASPFRLVSERAAGAGPAVELSVRSPDLEPAAASRQAVSLTSTSGAQPVSAPALIPTH